MRLHLSGGAVAASLVAACSYSWELGPSPDAGKGGASATSSSASTASASVAVSTIASSSGMPDGGKSCADLVGSLPTELLAAKKCVTSPNACMMKVSDECGCSVAVGNASAMAVTDYLATVAAIKAMSCPVSCSMCPAPGTSLCLVDGMQMLSCAP